VEVTTGETNEILTVNKRKANKTEKANPAATEWTVLNQTANWTGKTVSEDKTCLMTATVMSLLRFHAISEIFQQLTCS